MIVTFDKLSGNTVSEEGSQVRSQVKFATMQEAFAYAAELNNTEGIENIQIERIDTSR